MSDPVSPAELAELPETLPPAVLARVVALAADALPQLRLDEVPRPLRRFAAFAPARRARLAGDALATALADDADFRDALAEHVRDATPGLAQALDDGSWVGQFSPVDAAAVGYLLRPQGWAEVVDAVVAQPSEPSAGSSDSAGAAQLQRLRGQLASARAEIRRLKDANHKRLADLRSENADLRRRATNLSQQLRSAQEAIEAAAQQLAQERRLAEASAGQAEADARRLRARIGELESEAAAARRADREGREAGSLRTRLLLDAVIETAQGLRRELALPPVSTSPADSVAAVVPPGAALSGHTSGRPAGDPALLVELLNVPSVHLVVDGYNVTKTAWPTAALEAQRSRLLSGLAALVARTGAEVTVVFDGAELDRPPPVNQPRGVRVRFSPPGVIADEVIRDLVAAEPVGRPIVVVSSDREVAESTQARGARALPSRALVDLLTG